MLVLLLGIIIVAPRSVSPFAPIGQRKRADIINPTSSSRGGGTAYHAVFGRLIGGGSRCGGVDGTAGIVRLTIPGRRARRYARPSSLSAAAMTIPPRLALVGSAIGAFYRSYPALSSFLTAAILASAADGMAQYADECVTKFDVRRNVAMILYGGFVSGLCVEFMYGSIFPVIFGNGGDGRGGFHRAIRMTLLDECVNAPILWLPPAYVAQAMMYRTPKREALRKYINDIVQHGLLTKYWSLWIPMSIVNFSFVPMHFRVAFVAIVSFFWMIILSIVANRKGAVVDIGGDGDDDDGDIDEKICEAEPRAKLNPRAWD